MDPYSIFADPDPVVFLYADPDPDADPDRVLQNCNVTVNFIYKKNLRYEEFAVIDPHQNRSWKF